MAGRIQEPEKELRFTRAGQAVGFWVLSAVFAAAGLTLIVTSVYRDFNPMLPPLWSLAPFALALVSARIAIRLTRHAYLILTPLGIEIFPFFRPAAGMNLVSWQEIHSAEVDERHLRLTLHYNAAKTGGIHLSLRPIQTQRRPLLAKAVLARTAVADHEL